MLRRRFHSSGIYPSNASNGVYGVTKNLKLLPPNKVDAECIGVALIHKEHRIMIEKTRVKILVINRQQKVCWPVTTLYGENIW
jgi:hypothetical protein